MRVAQSSSMSWVGGTIGSPASEASYEVENVSLSPKLFDLVGGGVVGSPYAIARRSVGLRYGMDFDVILRGCDLTVGPHVGALLRACAFAETLNSGVSATYAAQVTQGSTRFLADPIAGLLDPIDLTYNIDGLKCVALTNAVGRVVVDFAPPNMGYLRFHFEAQHAATFDSATAMVALATERQPIPIVSGTDPEFLFVRAAAGGTSTNGSPSATVLTAAAGSFLTRNFQPGNLITNSTDGSTATIVSVDSATQLTTTALSGGGDNTWTTGDTYALATSQKYPNVSTGTGKFTVHSLMATIDNQIDPRAGFGTNGYHPPRLSNRGLSGFAAVMEEPTLSNNSSAAGFDWDRYTRNTSGLDTSYVILTYQHNTAGTGGDALSMQVAGKAIGGVGRSIGPAGLTQLAVTFDHQRAVVITSGAAVDLGGNGLTLQWT